MNSADKVRRYEMALESQCACNPVGLANTIVRWSKEILDAGGGTDTVRSDPAIRLATYQLAYLCGVSDSFDYHALTVECKYMLEKAKAQVAADTMKAESCALTASN